jgi:hypothetical protein
MRGSEQGAQEDLRQALLHDLRRPGLDKLGPLADWVRASPLTGRVALSRVDARWLQANPDQDPLLAPSDSLRMPMRPATVTVLVVDGHWCQVTHAPGATAAAYLAACSEATGAGSADDAWVVQPDGRYRRMGVQPWNAQAQDQPAPGAWIWAPSRREGVPAALSERLARWLGTQGPALDLAPGTARLLGPLALPRQPGRTTDESPRDLPVSASDWGEVGLLQTPTARMAPAGDLRLHWSRVWPYTRGTLMLQPMDWLEVGFRYTDVANRAYGPGNPQSYKDKSIDFKVRLLNESHRWPQLSAGIRDIGGTGLFSGEYLVASKRWGDFDASLGLGWGYLGARGDLGNPLSLLGSGFRQRGNRDVGLGGTVVFDNLFRGPTALFGGVQWHTPWSGLWLKAEIDGNDYRSEPQDNAQRQTTPLNLGLVWRPAPWVDISAGVERGQRMMLGLTLHSRLAQLSTPKLMDPPPPQPAALRPVRQGQAGNDWSGLAQAVRAQTEWEMDSVHEADDTLHLRLSAAAGPYLRSRADRVIPLMHAATPAGIRRFVIHFDPEGVQGVAALEIDRAQWLREQTRPEPGTPPDGGLRVVEASAVASSLGGDWYAPDRHFQWGLSPYFSQVLGGPDGFLLYQVGGIARARWALTDTLRLAGGVQARMLDNFDKFVTTGNSGLPPVRTFLREYVTASRVTIPYLYATHAGRVGRDQFYMAYGGLLEPMFGGLGAEWMWRPAGSPVSLSIDVNRVRQRAFEQGFAFRDYEATTGHLTLNWQTGWHGVAVSPSIGQYLAGDRGVTLEISRVFDNGVAMGAFATKTNVSAAVFGEGSFDKGIYVRVPFDAMLARSAPGSATLLWRPLTRDGGAKLARPGLAGLTHTRDPQAFNIGPPRPSGARRTGEPVFDDALDRAR